MKIYGIYDITDTEQVVLIGTISQVINFLNISPRKFDTIIKTAKLIDKKYQILYLFDED